MVVNTKLVGAILNRPPYKFSGRAEVFREAVACHKSRAEGQ